MKINILNIILKKILNKKILNKMFSKKEIQSWYKVSRPTLNKRLDLLGFEKGKRLFLLIEIQTIMTAWGVPQ
ncbi:MAG: hypothetical protein EAZ85_02995 [Bacteroidetes bacterium]|nr:MAG: hypothetical protein EAZ85_02995 [Bacteroidota bacterium]TAG93161.1 MAG: hypothetical protein EAZ20_01920 [Bacteroidota bacterium]